MESPPIIPAKVLDGARVRLEPLTAAHADGLRAAVRDGALWDLHVTLVPRPEGVDEFVAGATEAHATGYGLAFATIDKASGAVAGSTRYLNANLRHKRVEIGNTFLGATWQKTRVNTEAKLLMLSYAFDTLHVNRVEFVTDYLNRPSRNAILRLGAKEEGILRNHMVMPDGRVRDSVMFSIIRSEWAGIRQHLEWKLA